MCKKIKCIPIVLAIVLFVLAGCGEKSLSVPIGSSDAIGKNYEDVVSSLQNAGFTDIELVPVDDLTSESSQADGSIEQITINDLSSFNASDKVAQESKVSIVYHRIPRISFPLAPDVIQNSEFTDLVPMLKEAGFVNVYTEEVYDLDPDTESSETVNEISLADGNSVVEGASIPFDSDILITCHRPYAKYTVVLHIDFVGNFLFDKYDVKFLVDGEEQDEIDHGKDADYSLRLKEGEHLFEFVSADSSDVTGSLPLSVDGDIEAQYTLFCHSDEIKLDKDYEDHDTKLAEDEVKIPVAASSYKFENYTDVIAALEDLGFTNVVPSVMYDIFWGITDEGEVDSVSIDGNSRFSRGEVFKKDAEVIVAYHSNYDNSPERKAELAAQEEQRKAQEAERLAQEAKEREEQLARDHLEETFPHEKAKRAAVVFVTNGFATDVFMPDRNTLDPEKFHRYADTSGVLDEYYFTVSDAGEYTVKDELTWHISGMRLVHNYYGSFNSAKLDVDVTYDGENYYISNAKGTYAVTDISELMYTEEILTIPEYLVAVGRPSDK